MSADGLAVTCRSYINGVEPALTHIYDGLERTLCRLIPLFERVLTDLHRSNPLPQRIKGSYRYRVWDEPEPPEDSDDEEAWEQHSRDVRQWTLYRPIEIPDVPAEGYSGELTRRRIHRTRLHGRRLQVIIKVTDVVLVCDCIIHSTTLYLIAVKCLVSRQCQDPRYRLACGRNEE